MMEHDLKQVLNSKLTEMSKTLMRGMGLDPEAMIQKMRQGVEEEKRKGQTPVEILFYHCDHLGTPLALTDRQGQIAWAAKYDPWGNVEEEFNPRNLEQDIRLPGQHLDRETGLYYNYHRYYDPKIGAYINQDPIGLMGGLNLSIYTNGNPNNQIDPEGLAPSDGGPYHPPEGVSTGCTQNDTYQQIQGKMYILERMINSHQGWDWNMPSPRGGNRHTEEISNLWRAYAKCQSLFDVKCKQKNPQIGCPESSKVKETAKDVAKVGAAAVGIYVVYKIVRAIAVSFVATPITGAASLALS